MKTSIIALVLTAFTLTAPTASFTAASPDIGPQSSSEDSVRPISDHTLESIQGALAGKWVCAIGMSAIGVGLLTAAPATAGVTAIIAPFAFNAAAFCLI